VHKIDVNYIVALYLQNQGSMGIPDVKGQHKRPMVSRCTRDRNVTPPSCFFKCSCTPCPVRLGGSSLIVLFCQYYMPLIHRTIMDADRQEEAAGRKLGEVLVR
jgi:hypothetical protein